MRTLEVTISPDGVVQFLYDKSLAELIPKQAVIKRASHVEPVSIPLRIAFRALRALAGEYGWVSDFTRRWRCVWQVDMSPVGHGVLPTTFRNRADAIAAEIKYLNEFFL
jgi:hypothetical protein